MISELSHLYPKRTKLDDLNNIAYLENIDPQLKIFLIDERTDSLYVGGEVKHIEIVRSRTKRD